tara:strand:+ start:970 stop:1257 length:288 start_codon:yes stop_codon:yes gene_type:complete
LADLEMAYSVKVSLPSFSYQTILSRFADAERISMSPSSSKSVAYTDRKPSAEVEITCAVKVGWANEKGKSIIGKTKKKAGLKCIANPYLRSHYEC